MSFSELPVELQEKILIENPEMLSKYPLISKQLREAISHEYYNKLCGKDISKDKLIRYINSLDESLDIIGLSASGIFHHSIRTFLDDDIDFRNEQIQAKFYLKQPNGLYELTDLYLIYYNPDVRYDAVVNITNDISLQSVKSDLLNFVDTNPKTHIDILNMFNILANRRFCLEINSNYDVNFVLNYINYLYDDFVVKEFTRGGLDVYFYFLINDMVVNKNYNFYMLSISIESEYPFITYIDNIYNSLWDYITQI